MGGTVRRAPDRVITDYVMIPHDFMELLTYVTLVVDVVLVNKITFLVTLSHGAIFVKAKNIKSRTAKQLAKTIKRVMQLYSHGSMIVQTALMDMELDKTVDELSERTVVNTSAAREHVAKIERQICTTKERCHTFTGTLRFEVHPKLIITSIICFVVM